MEKKGVQGIGTAPKSQVLISRQWSAGNFKEGFFYFGRVGHRNLSSVPHNATASDTTARCSVNVTYIYVLHQGPTCHSNDNTMLDPVC